MTLLFRASARHLLRHRAQCVLAISGIALGVAIVMGIQITQQSARTAFERSLSGVFGTATHQVTALNGPLDEQYLLTVRSLAPHWQPSPIITGQVHYDRGSHTDALSIVGIDPISFARGSGIAGERGSELMRKPGAAIVSHATAQRLGLHTGQTITISAARDHSQLNIIGIQRAGETAGQALGQGIAIVDIATAQELLHVPGRLTRIELDSSNDASAADTARTLEILSAHLPATLTITSHGRNLASARELTRAFYTNLDALSLLALLVGAFMIYNTIAFLVVQRQSLFAYLRALGVTRATIARQVASEAIALGFVGGCIGNLLGYGLASMLMRPMSQTLSDHYQAGSVGGAEFSPWLALAGIALAVATSFGAAVIPALQAAQTAPARLVRPSAQERDAKRVLVWCERLGFGCALLGLALLLTTSRSLVVGFAALGCVLVAATLACPRFVQRLLHLVDRYVAAKLPLPERLAVKSASRSLGRIGMAIAALMAATATSIGIGLMVASFRVSVADWLAQLLRADMYISQDAEQHAAPSIDPHLIETLLADPRIHAVSKVRRVNVMQDGRAIQVTAYALPAAARAGFRFTVGEPAHIWRRWDNEDTVIVSQPFAYHHQLQVGDKLPLPTPTGLRTMIVTGIYTDYASERGVVAMSWTNFERFWGDPRAHGLGLYPVAKTDVDRLASDLRKMLRAYPGLSLWSNAAIKERSLMVFDRTFAVTDVLTLFAALIAALGVFNALLALHIERAREYAMLRATGCGRATIRRVIYAQTLIVAGAAIMLAIPVGLLIATLLIEIINVRSFGWTMELHLQFAALLLPVLMAFAAAFAATLYPAEYTARGNPAALLRYE